jgi:excisionase family DNA binding protein
LSDTINTDWMPAEPLLLTKEQAAALLNVSVRTISNLLCRRELVKRRIGTRCLIPRTSIDAFIKRDHATESEQEKQQRQRRKEQGS